MTRKHLFLLLLTVTAGAYSPVSHAQVAPFPQEGRWRGVFTLGGRPAPFNFKLKMSFTKVYLLITGIMLFGPLSAAGQTTATASSSFTIENYYKVRWGYAEEFIDLWKRNHYPLLKKAQQKGDIVSIKAEKPRQHSSEDSRWDFRVIIVFRTMQNAFDPNLTEPYKKQLYPDLEKLKQDEQHRFQLLLAHWDVLTEEVNLNQ